jgi:glutamine cyclotransferase
MYVCPWLDEPGEVPQTAYRVVRAYPHDPTAYTQGLVLEDGTLYESTGLRGASSLRRVELESGKVLQRQDIPEPYFGEGIAVHNGKIFQLTWQEGTGFIFDQVTFELLETFAYQTEGWGLTQDGNYLIRSEGTNRLAFIDPDILAVERILPVTSGGLPVQKLNELEYVQGEIWANVYLTSCVARIDPQDGRVVGWIDLSGLLSVDEMRTAEVPNGIAYDPVNERLLVSGKYWPWIFEIQLLPE